MFDFNGIKARAVVLITGIDVREELYGLYRRALLALRANDGDHNGHNEPRAARIANAISHRHRSNPIEWIFTRANDFHRVRL